MYHVISLIFIAVFFNGCGIYQAKYVNPANEYKSASWDISTNLEKKSNKSTAVYKEKIVQVDNESLIKIQFNKSIKQAYNFKSTEIKNYDSFALIIGINEYKQNTPVEYADLSALAFEELAITTLGIPKENVITLLNDEATSGQIKAKIELIKELSDNNGHLYVYFAGHGVPGIDGNTYILPTDMSAHNIHLEPNLQLNNIYSKLAQSNAKNVFLFIDSCFRDRKSVV